MNAVNIVGESKAIREVVAMVHRVAATQTNILILGESGTGKELVARMLHLQSQCRKRQFVPVNCGAIPENLLESVLFGHKRGSFTGAVMDKAGLFEVAHKGTLFLDEIGELPLTMQVKLLRAIQDKMIRRVGGNDNIPVDIRIISATNRNLEKDVNEGKFREDLYYRLNVISLLMPPLRDRDGDVRILAEYFLKKYSDKLNRPIMGFEPEVISALETYAWPGNVRELENVLERALALESGSRISLSALPEMITQGALDKAKLDNLNLTMINSVSSETSASCVSRDGGEIRVPAPDFSNGAVKLDSILGEIERAYLKAALQETSGVKKKAAELLGITFRSLRYRLEKLGF